MNTIVKDKKKLSQKEAGKKYYAKNAEFFKSKAKNRYKEKSESIKTKQKKYNLEHSEDRKTYMKSFYLKNKEAINIRMSSYIRNRLKTDPSFRILHNLRSRLRNALKNKRITKTTPTLELFGATQEEVWKHLEFKFKEGMTRENNTAKGWHIDHIKPMSSFDLSDPEQLKECCHYTNLQPLWWWENLEKSDNFLENS